MTIKRTNRHQKEKEHKIELLKEYMTSIFDLKDSYTREYLKEVKEMYNDRDRMLTSQQNEHIFMSRLLNNSASNLRATVEEPIQNNKDTAIDQIQPENNHINKE